MSFGTSRRLEIDALRLSIHVVLSQLEDPSVGGEGESRGESRCVIVASRCVEVVVIVIEARPEVSLSRNVLKLD